MKFVGDVMLYSNGFVHTGRFSIYTETVDRALDGDGFARDLIKRDLLGAFVTAWRISMSTKNLRNGEWLHTDQKNNANIFKFYSRRVRSKKKSSKSLTKRLRVKSSPK